MKPITFSKKSWHYWLAVNLGDLRVRSGESTADICSYIRNVIKGLFIGLLGLAVALAVTASVVGALYHIIGK